MNYNNKEDSYYNNVRLDVLSLLPVSSKELVVLEIGAGHGATLSFLKNEKIAKEVIGLDIPSNKGTCLFKNIDRFIYEDVENFDLKEYNTYFDYIILADVLEHLVNPDDVLKKLKPLLKEKGELLISIPNFRHKRALYKVFLKGDFSYEASGIFDYTHLRFYCKKNIKELVVNNGFKIDQMVSSLKTYKKLSPSKILNAVTFGVFEEFLTVQYLVRTKPK
ncbi:MAG: methyltransferase domain-containing protein [Flavobacteriaceae bacterium]|nr:methyltransferase domain-containing protein [Flavobacteriaceae bacterium]